MQSSSRAKSAANTSRNEGSPVRVRVNAIADNAAIAIHIQNAISTTFQRRAISLPENPSPKRGDDQGKHWSRCGFSRNA
jgi:hypothetical protein